MNLEWGQIEFRSIPAAYVLEKKGFKNHTERMLSIEEVRMLDKRIVERICIRNTENGFCFVRKITNIYEEGSILGHYLYSFTWAHEETEG